jgi:hypothetical protein
MAYILALPVFLILIILQITVSDKIVILHGFGDLILVWLSAWVVQIQVRKVWFWVLIASISVAFISAAPWYVPFISFGAIAGLGHFIQKRLWQSPLLSLFVVIVCGSIVYYSLYFFAISISGVPLTLKSSLSQIIIPSILINCIYALPIYLIAKDMASWIFPVKEEV